MNSYETHMPNWWAPIRLAGTLSRFPAVKDVLLSLITQTRTSDNQIPDSSVFDMYSITWGDVFNRNGTKKEIHEKEVSDRPGLEED